jgi:hypothetical protein
MAEAKKAKGVSSKVVFWAIFLLIAGIGAASGFLYKKAEKARAELDEAKRQYREMTRLKGIVAKGRSQARRPPSANETDENIQDILPFLERKRAAAGIPQNLFNVARNNPPKQGKWTETSYTVTLRGTKEAPVPRNAVADFLVAVETERPSIKSRNLNLTFAPSSGDLASVSITFSQFQGD